MAENSIYRQIIQLAQPEFEQYAQLPFAVCLLSREGVFLKYNESGRLLFDLPLEPSFQDSISHFYLHKIDRQDHLRRLEQLPPGRWLNETALDLDIGGSTCYLRDSSIAIWDEEGQNIIGLLSLMINSSKSDRYHGLFSELPMGLFSLRFKEGLVNANRHFLEMHGYDSLVEIKNRSAEFFMNDIIEVKELEYKVRQEGQVVNRLQEHKRKNGTVFSASISVKAVCGIDGKPIGIDGIVEDVSNKEIYFKMVDNVPMGLYKIRINGAGEHIIAHCNQQFAQHLGFNFPSEIIGRDVRLFHRSSESFQNFHDQLVQKNQEGKQLVDHIVELRDAEGKIRRHEVHSNLLKDANGKIIGRVGAERDVTDLWETRQQLNELTTDIGKVLHSYSSTLIHSKHSMEAVMRSFSTSDLLSGTDNLLDAEVVFNRVKHEAKALKSLFDKLLAREAEQPQIPEHNAMQLFRILNLIQSQGTQFDMRQLALIRDGSIKIKEISADLSNYNFPKEWIKQIKRQLDEVLRLCSLITLSVGVDAILEMETNVNNLRSYILTRVKPKEKLKKIDIYDLMIGVVRNMTEYATNRNIELRLNAKQLRNAYVKGNRTDLVRALLNILHNAIKYSWVRKSPAKAYVQIEGRADEENLYLSIANWGVAITKEEVEKGLIFKVGYRGANSRDRRRPGTGLGLYDSKKVIEQHHGNLTINSKPSLGNSEEDYSKPFVTTVNIQLPRDGNL